VPEAGGKTGGAESSPAAHRSADGGKVRSRTFTRTSCARASSGHPEEGRGQGNLGCRSRPARSRARSSISWRHCARVLPRPRVPLAGHASGPRKAPKRVEEPAKVTRKAEQAQRLKQRDAARDRDAFLQCAGRERVLQLAPDTTAQSHPGGFVHPARGPRREYRFSFQDLIVLRTAARSSRRGFPKALRRTRGKPAHNLPNPCRCRALQSAPSATTW